MRKFAILLAASAAAVVAVPASAATIVTGLGAIVVPPTQTLSPGVTFTAAGDNSGYYTFTTSQANTVVSSVFTNAGNGNTGLFNFSSIGLYTYPANATSIAQATLLESGTVGTFANSQFASLAPFTLALAGNYAVAYTGTVSGAPAGVGSNFTFTAGAVPEASTWAMMMIGFGMMGFGLRRRKSNVKTTVSFG